MRIVGLTGGISSGKSTVSNLFKSHGVPIVDADLVARDVLKKGTGGWKKVVAAFGKEILQANGEVDRAQLGQIVFSDPAKRQILNRTNSLMPTSFAKLIPVSNAFASASIIPSGAWIFLLKPAIKGINDSKEKRDK
uniref:Dephospho-CoA kinase n=1 Tax=Quercus lobata TaxID=97700 RepID=A0A7N2N4N5_QUELO